MKACIVLGDGRRVSAGAYARAMKAARDNPDVWFKDSPSGWGACGRDVWHRFVGETIDDQINKRGGLAVREVTEARIARKRKAQLALTCVWCGCAVEDANLNAYYPGAHVFCSGGCRRAYQG